MAAQPTDPAAAGRAAPDKAALETLVAEADLGGRHPANRAVASLLVIVPLAWALFQLWYASPLPFSLGIFVLNDTEARAIHLAFALFLAFVAYPALKRSPRRYVPWQDWLFAAIGAFCGAYLFIFYRELATRPGQPSTFDLVASVAGLVLLLESARRALGIALPLVSCIFIAYIFLGPYMPDLLAHKGASLSRAMSQLWLTTEGVFGVALGVSTSFVFLFVLFGALLEKAGAGNYFIQLSFALLGHLRGGPAKAAVVSSGATGLISGSSVANVVTTGTFTIPLMKRVGYAPTKAGAVEVAASVNGQIMPPVMGAAAFLIAEYVGIPYAQVVKHAILPALITYLALFYVVDIEAVKAGLKGLPRTRTRPRLHSAGLVLMNACLFILFCAAVYYGIGWTKDAFGAAATWIVGGAATAFYVALIAYRARHPDLPLDDPDAVAMHLPDAKEVARTGLHYLVPVFVLVWCLMVEHLSPGLSAFWGTLVLVAVVVTQHPLTALFRGEARWPGQFRRGAADLVEGLAIGSRNMIGIGIATAAAGIVVGTVTLTGIGLVLTEVVDYVSGGNIILMLLLTAVICLVLGLGMPTTASYVVVATLMAPVIVELAAQNDLAVPLVAVHLFVFYFGLMADVTPPVGLASFAAAAISGASPVATGVQAFRYEIRTALLPFVFIFNNELLLIDIGGPLQLILVAGASLVAMLLFVAATQGHFLTRSRLWESALLLLVCFTLFRPGFWMDMIYAPFAPADPKRIVALAKDVPPESFLRLVVTGETRSGREVTKTVKLRLGAPGEGAARLRAVGLQVAEEDGKMKAVNVRFRTQAAKLGIEPDAEIKAVLLPADRPAKHWMLIPALLLLAAVSAVQWRRAKRMPAAVPI
ncbi:MAG: TRAP transporter permease [Rhodospirillaceae bacterium]|nr:TRAP transporter permease [Rhodospirillaceae bacterium]